MCVGVGVCFDLLSLLVIHLCEHCHYQPQDSLWLTVWYLHYFLKCAKTSNHNRSYLLQLILCDREKNYAGLLQDKNLGPG